MAVRNQPPTCCFCCHVKTGTFALSILVLVSGILAVVMSSLLLSGALSLEEDEILSNEMMEDKFYQNVSKYQRSTLWVGLGNGVFIALISCLAIYGLMKNRSGFLLPFFIIQLFNFLCTIVSIGSLAFYWPSVKLHIIQCRHMPEEWKDWLMSIDDRWLACIVLAVLFIVLLVKFALISMVYRCYKHITTQVLFRQRCDPEISFVADNKPELSPIYKPPKYEDIQKVPLVSDIEEHDSKPPPYQA